MIYKVATDRGDITTPDVRNINEARDYVEEKEVGARIYRYIPVEDTIAIAPVEPQVREPQGGPKGRR